VGDGPGGHAVPVVTFFRDVVGWLTFFFEPGNTFNEASFCDFE